MIHCKSGKYKIRYNISKIKEKLDKSFLRIHKSYIINKRFLKKLSNNEVILEKQISLPVGRSFKEKILEIIN